MQQPFRILSLDGGGIKGAYAASVLAAIEQDTKKSTADYFDLIVGTSTGGIIAIGLGLGISAAQIVEFYRKHGPTIFPATSRIAKPTTWLKRLFTVRHSASVLRAAISDILGDKKFGESKCRLVIPTYDAIGGRLFLLKTAHDPRFKYDYMATAVDVALATSAAPTYFEAAPFPQHQEASYVDGGVWANSPAMVGICEGNCFLNTPIQQISLLSIGATSTPFNIAKQSKAGPVQWNSGFADLMFNAQVEAANTYARLLLGERYYRINTLATPGQFALDDASPQKISHLIQLGRSEALKSNVLKRITADFINDTPAAPFIPCYSVPPDTRGTT